MAFLNRFFVLIFLLSICSYSLHSQSGNENALTKKFPPSELREDAALIKNVVMSMHPVIGIYRSRAYYNQLFDQFINSLNDSLTEKQFRIKLKIILDELHCGHTELISSKQYLKALNKQRLSYSPYIFMPLQDKVFMLGSLSVKKDTVFKRGYEIKRINDVGTDSMISVCKKMITGDGFINTGKDYYLKLGFNSYYPALFGRPDTFKVEYTNNHEIKTIKYPAIHVRSFPPIPLSPKDDSLFTVYKRANMKFRYLDQTNKTFLLKITAFSRKKEKKAYRRIFRKLEKNKTENLIIDLRNNGGGSLANSYRLLSYLLTKNETQTLKTSIKNYPYRKYTSGNIWFRSMRFVFKIVGTKKTINDTDNYIYTIKKSKKHHYNNRVFVLINGGSFSASCLVAAYLKQDKRAVFIGEETSGTIEGCNAGITPYYKLPNTKMKLRVPAFRVQHDVCPEITGRGIIPEYKVNYTFNDILKRKDLELEKVKELIK